MRDVESNEPVGRYLADLDLALVVLPPATAADIREGVREELSGLDPDAARERIAQLGDPARIAAEARAEVDSVSAPRPTRTSTWYIVVTGVAFAISGFVPAGFSLLVGLVMLWVSPTWTRWEKWLATLAPGGTAVVAGVIVAGIAAPQAADSGVIVSVALSAGAVALSAANVVIGILLVVVGVRRVGIAGRGAAGAADRPSPTEPVRSVGQKE